LSLLHYKYAVAIKLTGTGIGKLQAQYTKWWAARDGCHSTLCQCRWHGVTREQVLEAASVAVMMQGGPGFTYMPVVMDALDALKR